MRWRVAGSDRSAASTSPASMRRSYRSWIEAIAPAAYTAAWRRTPGRGRGVLRGQAGGSGGRRLATTSSAIEQLAAVPRGADAGQHPPVQAVPAGVAPGQHEEQTDDDERRVDAGRAGEHEAEVEDDAEERHDAGQQPQDQADPDDRLADRHYLGHPRGVVVHPVQEADPPAVGHLGVVGSLEAATAPLTKPWRALPPLIQAGDCSFSQPACNHS